MAAWYAQNKTAIDELITATSAAADSSVVLDVAQAPIAAPPPAPATLTEDIQSAVNGSGATVLTSDVGVDLPVETDATVEQRRRRRKRRRAREQAERDGAAAAAALAQQTEVTFDEPDEAVVYGTARKGGVPIVAVGVGVVVLGGALWWMSRKGRRRAA